MKEILPTYNILMMALQRVVYSCDWQKSFTDNASHINMCSVVSWCDPSNLVLSPSSCFCFMCMIEGARSHDIVPGE
jgi:hypothetical protein